MVERLSLCRDGRQVSIVSVKIALSGMDVGPDENKEIEEKIENC